MSSKRLPPTALLVVILCGAMAFAEDIELVTAKSRQGALSSDNKQSFVISLNRGDFAQVKFVPQGKELVVRTYEPSGNRFRGTVLGPDESDFNFVAHDSGNYRIEVAGKDPTTTGTYIVTLKKVVPLDARVTPPKPSYQSPRIKALKDFVESGDLKSVDEFWREVKEKGAPLIEPLAGDDKNMLVTFLWQGTPDTRDIFVLRFPYASVQPDEWYMSRLGNTNVWYKTAVVGKRTRFDYRLAANVPRPYGAQGLDGDAWSMIMAAARPDPLNPKVWRIDMKSLDLPEYRGNSVVEMPDAPAQPWIAEKAGIPTGRIEKHRFKSSLLNNEREIAVYLPAGYSKTEKPYPLLLLFDGRAYLSEKDQIVLVPTPTILDNLIAGKRIPPIVAILVGNVAGARNSELACNPVFIDFLVSELLPWAHGLYNFTTEPSRTVIAGSSFGGLTATCSGLRHPEKFGNILSQSGSYWWTPASDEVSGWHSDSEPNWVARQFIANPKLPLRFYLDAGSEELDFSGGGDSILLTTRTLRDVLLAKGYEVHFQEFAGGHDFLSWRETLADGLISLIGQ